MKPTRKRTSSQISEHVVNETAAPAAKRAKTEDGTKAVILVLNKL